jgi:hypothetical protein
MGARRPTGTRPTRRLRSARLTQRTRLRRGTSLHWRTTVPVGLGVLLVAVIVALAGTGPLGSTSAAPRPATDADTARLALPRLGPIRTVDQNDVGDPFVLAVPAGVRPPTDVPYVTTGYDAYQSAPWSAATAATAQAHGWYVLFGTTDWQGNVPTAISTDLVHWTQAPDALPVLPAWAVPTISMTWAPAALHTSAGWVLYFSTEAKRGHLECVGRAVSSSPAGPYTDRSSAPLVCQRRLGGSIDPSVIRDRSGTEFLIWKNNGNGGRQPDHIWAEALTATGLAVHGGPHLLLSASEAWTHGVIEAPAMIPASAGGYWLFYAGGAWNSDRYGTGLAHCASVLGPCRPTGPGPFLATTKTVVSPGTLDTVTAHDGRLWAVFTALIAVPAPWHPGHTYYNRVLDVAPILSR